MLEKLVPYRKELLVISVSVLLLLIGLIFSGAVIAGLIGFLFRGRNFAEWNWSYDELWKVFAGTLSVIAGIVGLMIGIIRNRTALKVSITAFLVILVVFSSLVSFKLVMDRSDPDRVKRTVDISSEDEVFIDIPVNSTATDIAGILKKEGLIKSTFIFRALTRLNGYGGKFQSGTHKLGKGLGYEDIMDILITSPESIKVTIPEGYTYRQALDLLKEKMGINRDEFERVAHNLLPSYKFLEGLKPEANRLEGYIFPDTYYFGLKDREEQILKTILDNFDKRFRPEFYDKAKQLNMSVNEIITLASIVEKEARAADERKTIAGVFYNRLKGRYGAPRKLESCATVQYVFLDRMEGVADEVRARIQKGILSTEDTRVDDVYNTYKYEKLPPGPVCNPGLACIEAVLYPEDTEYIYFVARGDGTNDFSKTNAEHVSKMYKYGLIR